MAEIEEIRNRKLSRKMTEFGSENVGTESLQASKSLKASLPQSKEFYESTEPVTKLVENLPETVSSMDSDTSGNNRRAVLLKERARILASRSKYYEATSVLEDIEEEYDIEEFGMKLLMAECYLQLGRENKANKWVRELRTALIEDPTLEAEEIYELVENLLSNRSLTACLILLPVASELFKRTKSPDDTLEGLFRCIRKANDCVRPMISNGGRDRILAIDLGMDYMIETQDVFLKLEVDAKQKAFKQCLATTLIAYNYWLLKDNLKGVNIREAAVKAMEKAFGVPLAKQRRVYGNSLYNIGVGYAILNKHAEAKAAYNRALDAIECATDFTSESDRQRELKMCKQKLKDVSH